MRWNKRLLVVGLLLFPITVFPQATLADVKPERLSELPPPSEIRDYRPQANRLMVLEYANEREFLFRIEKIIPRSECNHVRFDAVERKIRIITQAPSNAYEYVLEGQPIMISEWVTWNE
jgi:hypothetical protein